MILKEEEKTCNVCEYKKHVKTWVGNPCFHCKRDPDRVLNKDVIADKFVPHHNLSVVTCFQCGKLMLVIHKNKLYCVECLNKRMEAKV